MNSIILIFIWLVFGMPAVSHAEVSQTNSLIDWKKIDYDEWLSFDEWKERERFKEGNPDYESTLRAQITDELVGRVIHCIGSCRIFRGEGFSNGQHLSSVKEGDEIVTLSDSFIWIYLLDGTIVYLAAESSLSFNEINLSKETPFLFARLNMGGLAWFSRSSLPVEMESLRTTDPLFKSLPLESANSVRPSFKNDLFAMLEDEESERSEQVAKVNEWIVKNNVWANGQKNYSFLIFPNGSVSGTNLNVHILSILGDKSYLKVHGENFWKKKSHQVKTDAKFHFRGFVKSELYELDSLWYEISGDGREITPAESHPLLHSFEQLQKRIPTILLAREILHDRYGKEVIKSLNSPSLLSKRYGHRLWGDITDSESDLFKRFSFLKEYTRRIETSNLLMSSKLKKRLEERGEKMQSMTFDRHFLGRSLDEYAIGK